MSPTNTSKPQKVKQLPLSHPRPKHHGLLRGLALAFLMATQGAHAAVSDQNYDGEPVGSLGVNAVTLNGYDYTNDSSNAIGIVDDGDLASGADHAFGFRSNGANTSTQVRFMSSDGGEFKLNSFAVSTGLGNTTNLTIKGYRDGGEVASTNYDLSGVFFGTFDVSGDSNWENIDEVRITGSDLDIDIDDLDVSPAVEPSDSDGNLSSSGIISEPVGLDSTVDTASEAVDVFDFTLTDGGTSDGLSMNVSEVVINVSGTTTDTVRDQITWRLNGNDASNVTGTYDAGADTITFSGLSISIADGGSETYTVNAYYNDNTGLTEDNTIILSIDGDTDLTVGGSGTQMGATSAVNNGSGTTVDVTATGLAFTTQPAGSTSGSALSTQPVVSAQDAFGNTDVDFTETITLTEASAGSLSGDIDVAASGGVATFTDVTYTATADQQSFTLTADDQSGTGSDLPTVDANSVTSDVVATQLLFETQPSPTTIDSGITTNMTTVPVVSAVDANDVVDTGYGSDITLAEVNGPGSATMSGTGDNDGSGATVAITPSSGTSTFTGLQLTYTASGGSDETFNLQASSGGLATVNSNLFTAVVNQPPTDIGLNSSSINQSASGSGSIIGALSTTDADVGDTHTYSIVGDGASGSGSCGATGDDDNASFQVDNTNGELEAAGALAAGSYNVCLQTSDGIATYQESFAITVADDVAPTVSSINVPSNGTYTAGQNLDFTVNSNENITVNTSGGTPRVSLTVGSATRYASYVSGSGSSSLVFRYTVQPGDEDTDGIAVGALEANGGTLQDAASNSLNTTLNSVGDTSSVLVDAVAPTGHSVSFDDETLNGTEATAASFTFASAEVGADYSYTISSDGGGTPVTGSGTVASAGEQISGIDVSGLSDGTLTLSVTLTDAAGNSASAVTDISSLDTTAPSGQSVSFDDGTLNGTEAGSASFTFASAEVGASYSYTINSDGGGTPVTGSGTVVSAGEQISGIDVSGLSDGTLTLSVTLTDTVGNSASAVTDTATLDASAPSSHSVSFDDGTLNASEAGSTGFTFASAEVGADYSYTISSSGGGTPVTGSGTVASAGEQISNIDASGLSDGTLTLSVTLTDTAGNTASAVTDTASLDTTTPAGHSVSFDDEPLNGTEATAASFTFASAEVGADYSYTISSDGGGTPVTGSGTVASAGEQISGIDVSGLSDGTLTLSVTLTDAAGNSASAVTDMSSLDTTAPSGQSVSFDDGTLNGTEAGSASFTFASAEVGASYSYTINSDGGGTPVTGSGTVVSAGEQISGIDVSGLSDGTLTLSVTLTDTAGNSASAVTDTATLDATSPTTSVSTAASDPTNGAFDITVTFNETVSGFDVSDITATNASLSNFSGSGSSYTTTVTPTADGSVSVDVAADVAQDSVGNGNTAATTLSLTYDGTAPAPTITSAETSPSNSASFTATINFGEAVSGFAVGDISAGNATLGGFTDNGDGSFDVTVTPSSEGTVTLDVGASAAQDTAGNNSEAASQFSLEHDDSAPSLTGSSPVDGATGIWFNTDIDLTFSEAVTGQSGGVIEVFEADGTPVSSVSATSSDVSISGSTATIDIPDLEPTVSYYVQVSSGAFADSAGNIYGGIANDTELNFTVTNLAPSAGGDAAQIVEDQSADLGILSNDTDPEGDLNPASVQIVTPPAHGSTSIDTGSGAVTYTPDANFAGQDSFTYTVEDALGAVSNEATMTIGIININDAPMAGDDTANTPEDNPISIDVAADDTDIDDGDSVDPSTIVITAAPANGSAELVSGEVLYTPKTDFNGTDQFSYTIEDQNGGVSNAATVIVNVNGVNDTPTAADDSASVDEDNPVDVDVTANDSDIDGSVDATTVQVLDDVTNGTLSVDGTTGVVTYTPDENFNGTDTFTYVMQDNANGTSNEATVTLTVNSVNDAPVAEDNAATLQEETPHEVNVLGNDSDVDGSLDTASVEVASAPSDGSTAIDTATGAITYTPDENFDGNDSFTYRVMDNEGAWSNVATVSMTVQGVNDAPLANDDDATTEEDTPTTIDLLNNDNDVDGTLNAASIALTSPTHGSVSLNGDGTATYTPDEHFNGADSFTYTVNDDVGEPSNSATVSVTVTPVNDAPTLSGTPAASVNEGEAYSFTPTADDVDANETLTFSVTGQPAWAEFDNTSGALTGTPGIAASGRYPGIVISVSDGDATTELAAFSIEVIDVNNAPTIGGTAPTTATVGQAYTFTATAEDSDESDTLTFSATGLPGWLTLDSSTGELTGTPADDDVGSYTGLQVSVSDGAESASLAAFDLTVEPGADSDGDSFSDYQEGLDGTDPNDPASYLDLMPPQLAAPDERVLDAEALFTQITLRDLLGLEEEASDAELQDALDQLASDDIDGNACCNPRVEGMEGNQLRLAPGRHEITWLAEDFQNNSAEATQVVNIRPMVSLSKDQVAVAGNTVEFSVILNGESPFYPLTIPYRVSEDSTANGEDHDLTDGTVVLEAGEQHKTVEVTLAPNDGESRETLIVELDDRTGKDEDLADGYDRDNPNIYDINSGAKRRHRIAIVDGNVAPRVQLQLVQGEERRRLVPMEGGTATVTALVADPNAGDSHQYDWSASDSALVDTDGDSGNDTLVFEPQSLNPGRYRVAATVTDSAGEATSVSRHFVVVPVPPALNPGEDSDADGIDDATEGFADDNGNGIPNYQDSLVNTDVLLESADQQDAFLMECDPGLACGLGAFALPTGNGGAQIGEETVGLTGAIPADALFEPVGGIFDFELAELPELGQSARIVIPQRSPIPARATYRKFQNGTWVTFVEDADNALHSAEGEPGFCPPPGDDDWESGLVEGYHCVQLTIEDGGPNDADGEVNGSISDPGAVSQAVAPPAYDGEVTTRSSGGGGSTTGLFGALLLTLGLARRFVRRTATGGHRKRRGASRTLSWLPLLALAGLMLPGQQANAQWLDDVQFELGLYRAKSDVTPREFRAGMAKSGAPVTLSQYDVDRRAMSLEVGLPLTDYVQLDIGYLSLGDVTIDFEARGADPDALALGMKTSYPYSTSGWTIAPEIRIPLEGRMSLLLEAGLYRWGSETTTIGPNLPRQKQNGVDPLLGAGFELPVNERLDAGFTYRRVFFNNQSVDMMGVSLSWHY